MEDGGGRQTDTDNDGRTKQDTRKDNEWMSECVNKSMNGSRPKYGQEKKKKI